MKMAIIKRKTKLHALLHSEGYDKIVFFEAGDHLNWAEVSSSYTCDLDGMGNRIYPIAVIRRVGFFDRSHNDIRKELDDIERWYVDDYPGELDDYERGM